MIAPRTVIAQRATRATMRITAMHTPGMRHGHGHTHGCGRTSTARSRSASRSTSPSSPSRRSTAGASIRSRCSPTPATTWATCSASSSRGPARSPAGSPPTTPHLRLEARVDPRRVRQLRCCCWSRSARSRGRRSAASPRRQPIAAGTVMVVAAIGIVVNVGTALLFLRGRHDDLNIARRVPAHGRRRSGIGRRRRRRRAHALARLDSGSTRRRAW